MDWNSLQTGDQLRLSLPGDDSCRGHTVPTQSFCKVYTVHHSKTQVPVESGIDPLTGGGYWMSHRGKLMATDFSNHLITITKVSLPYDGEYIIDCVSRFLTYSDFERSLITKCFRQACDWFASRHMLARPVAFVDSDDFGFLSTDFTAAGLGDLRIGYRDWFIKSLISGGVLPLEKIVHPGD